MISKKLAAIVALAVSAALAGTGCMAQSDDEMTDGQDQAAAPTAQTEKTGTASEKCGGFGLGGFGCGGSCGIPFWGGWGGCGIFGGPFFGGYGCFGGGGFGCGGFGGGFGGCGGGCW